MSPDSRYLQYWRFFWPLALNGVIVLVGQIAFNGVLARHADPERELAVFACAIGIFYFFDIGTAFMPNMVTVFARSLPARDRVWRFCITIGVAFTVPVWLLGASSAGQRFLSWMYPMPQPMLDDVAAYLRMLSALATLHVIHHYLNGVLILAGRTSFVSIVGIVAVALGIATALWGFARGWPAVMILGLAEWLSGLFKAFALALLWRRQRRVVPDPQMPAPGYAELFAFFWPVCVSGMSFGLSRPLLFTFVARVPAAVSIMAAMRVSMDFVMLFQSVVNQFRHFFAAFGLEDLAHKRRFMLLVGAALIGAMALLLLIEPASEWFFIEVLGLQTALYQMARFMCHLLLVVPVVLMVRNYYHGVLIVWRRTTAMALGSAARVAAIGGSAALMFYCGILDQRSAVLGLIAGFCAETGMAMVAVRRLRGTRGISVTAGTEGPGSTAD